MRDRLRVLQVCAPARSGGLESVVTQLSAELRARGHNVQVAAVLSPGNEVGHPFLEGLEARGVPVHAIVLGGRAYVEERRRVKSLALDIGATVVHTHGYRADVLHGGSALALGLRHIMTLHGFVSGSWRDRAYEFLQVRAARHASTTVAVSRPIVERLAQAGIVDNVRLVRNAIGAAHAPLSRPAAREALGIPLDVPAIGWVGRASVEKGPDVFVDALAKTSHDVHGVLVGDGPMREAVIARADAAGIRARFHTPGNVPNARRYLAAFDAFALTSRTEGTPMVMLEAMQAGIPVVTTMVGGIPDVANDENAWCCMPGDVEALARAFSAAVRVENVSARVAQATARIEQQFGLAPWLDTHEDIYDGVVRGASSAR